MKDANLFVYRISGSELHFVLQMSGDPVLAQAAARIGADERRNITAAFADLADCLEGAYRDEPKYRRMGKVFYRCLVPEDIRLQLRELNNPLTILTNEPALPWELFHDDEEFLSLRLPISRQLIMTEQLAKYLVARTTQPAEFSALVITDPTGDLKGARAEGEALDEYFRTIGTCRILRDHEASAQAILCALADQPYSVIHYCGHIDYHAADRRSTIRLRDGSLTPDQLRATFSGGKPVVFLNACYSDVQSDVRENSGRSGSIERTANFAKAFMLGNEHGVADAVVGALWRIPEEPVDAGREFALKFYQSLLAGQQIGEALRQSRLLARERKWGPMVWGPYVMYGNATTVPFPAARLQAALAQETSSSVKKILASDLQAHTISAGVTALPDIAQPEECDEEQITLDTQARQVLLFAQEEMEQGRHQILSSLHLLIGLTMVDDGSLQRLLHEREFPVSRVCDAARRRIEQIIPVGEHGFGISQNVVRIFMMAEHRACIFGHTEITDEDIFSVLLDTPECEALAVLDSLGLHSVSLREQLSAPSLAIWSFDPPARRALHFAQQEAVSSGLGFIDTSHLLAGVIHTEDKVVNALLAHFSVDGKAFCAFLREQMGRGPVKSSLEQLTLRPRAQVVLSRAWQIIRQHGRTAIMLPDMLEAILAETGGAIAPALQHFGIQAEEAISFIHDLTNVPTC